MSLSSRLKGAPLQQPQLVGDRVEWGQWTPDAPPEMASLTVCRNVIPDGQNSYRPFRALSPATNALGAKCLGGAVAFDVLGVQYIYAGTGEGKLYEAAGATFADCSKSGGYDSDTVNWEFCTFGNQVIATNFLDPVQVINIGGGGGGDFADLFTSTLKPRCKHIATVGDFVVMGHTIDATDSEQSARIWWTAFNDATDADPSPSTQCDYQQLPEGGAVQRIVGGDRYGLVIQDSMTRAIQYVGAPLVFQITPIDFNRGTQLPNSVVKYGNAAYWWGDDGFMASTGQKVDAIGDARLDKYVRGIINPEKANAVTACVNRAAKTIMWGFPLTAGGLDLATRVISLHVPTMRWSETELSIERLMEYRQIGYTLEDLDAISTDIDAWPDEVWDSPKWIGSRFSMGGFGTDHKLGSFSDWTLQATLTTGDLALGGIGAAEIREVWHLSDAAMDAKTAINSRRNLGADYTEGAYTAATDMGMCPVRGSGRFLAISGQIDAGVEWTFWDGFSWRGARSGER